MKKRILRIQPDWDGKYLFDKRKPVEQGRTDEQKDIDKQRKKKLATSIAAGVALEDAISAIDNVGEVTQEQMDAAHLWHQQLPDMVLANAENPYGAQALILALLLHERPEIESKQFDVLSEAIGELHTQNVKQVQRVITELERSQTLSLIDLILPTLREMTLAQYMRNELAGG